MLENQSVKKSVKRFAVPLGILGIAIFVSQVIISNPPEAQRFGPSQAPQMTVEVMDVVPRDYQIKLDSFGVVRPRTESVLVAQTTGQIKSISENFRNGGFFEQGEVLVSLDDRDNKADLKVAKANLLDAKQKLAEEQARGKQAEEDWRRLGKPGQPSDLVLRKPQLRAAEANVLSAEAQVEKAQLALERTQIVAPYAGRILKKHVDVGQVVSNNSQLAEIYAVDYVEVRLPINNQDLALIELPEEFRFSGETAIEPPTVAFTSDISANHQWQGNVVRTEGAIDENSQQLYIVAQISDPYGEQNKRPIKIGQYVTATVEGKKLSNVLAIPNKAIYQGSYVYLVENGLLMRRDISVRWKNDEDAIIRNGLSANDKVVLTPLGRISSGTRVAIKGEIAQQNPEEQLAEIKTRLENMPEERRKKLEMLAKERGISVEQLMQERMSNKTKSALGVAS